jgi:hypothetical protein
MRIRSVHSMRGERCGIHQYGAQLDRSFQKLGIDVSTSTYDLLPKDVQSGEVVLFHYEPSLITSPLPFQECMKRVRQVGGKIVFCCHWYKHSETTKYDSFVDKYILHRTYPDANSRSVVIPLGAPLYDLPSEDRSSLRGRFGLPVDRFILTTVGFLAEWKKMPDVVERLADVLPDSMLVRVQAPLPYLAAGKAYYQQDIALKKAAEKWPGRVIASTDFLSEKDLTDLVHASDLGFVFHPQDTGSVSAATKQFVSARVPVVVTGSTHAADVVRGVRRVGSFEIDVFAREVVRIASDVGLMEKLRKGIALEYDRINMDVVAKRYVEEFGKL